ncbi:diguanylate cyclase [bacterium]|nr:diguanylate cyclase [bacterium]
MRKSFFTLRKKIIIIFTLIIVFPLIIATILVTKDLRHRAQLEIDRHAETAFNIFHRYLKTQVRYNEIRLKNLSLDHNLKNMLNNNMTDETGTFLKNFEGKHGVFQVGVLYPDENGKIECKAYSSKNICDLPSVIDYNTMGKGEILSSYFVCSEDKSNEKYMFVISVIKNVDTLTGKSFFIRMILKFEKCFIDDFKEFLNLNLTLYTRKVSFLTTFFNADGIRPLGVSLSESQNAVLNNPKFTGIWKNNLGQEYFSYYRYLESKKEIAIEISIQKTSIKQTSNMIINYLILLLIISLILAAIAGFALSKNIIVPIKILSEATNEISQGDLDLTVKMDRNDEIGSLADDFNVMTSRLRKSYERLQRKIFEISTLFEISKNMSFVNDTDVLVEIIIDRAVSALNAQRGSLMIMNEEIDKLEVKVVRGIPGEVRSYTRLSPGEGIAGKVFSSKQGMLVNYGEDDPMFLRSEIPEKEMKILSLICVPMKAKDNVIGVINIINKNSDNGEFNADDMNLLNAIASQAAMAIENAKLYEQSITDGMTKLFIHRYFQLRLEEELNRAGRYGAKLSLIMFDVDHFKNFNDTYGHQTGDIVLKEVSKTIKDTVRRDVDIAARYGGEEFAVILPETNSEEAVILAERLRISIADKKIPGPDGKELSVNVSLGVSEFPLHASNRMALIKCADVALYYAKEHGRNKTVVYEKSMS